MKTNGPWKIKNTKVVYQNPWIKVREDQVIRPDGKDGIFGVVEMIPGVSVLPMDDKGYVYLTCEFHYAIENDTIEVASGAIDENEEPLNAAKRELLEELGIEAQDWTDLGRIDSFTTVVNSPAQMYLARKLTFRQADPEESEQIEMVKMKFEDAVKMVMDSEITHAGSALLIMKAAKYLEV